MPTKPARTVPTPDASEPKLADIRRVALAVRTRRERLGLGQDLSARGGPKRNMVGNLETRNVWPKLPATRARWAMALKWEPDAFDRILAGDDPIEASGQAADPEEIDEAFEALERAISALRRRIRQPE